MKNKRVRVIHPKAKRTRCSECGRLRELRGRLHIEGHPGTDAWQCSDDDAKCKELFLRRWAEGHR